MGGGLQGELWRGRGWGDIFRRGHKTGFVRALHGLGSLNMGKRTREDK